MEVHIWNYKLKVIAFKNMVNPIKESTYFKNVCAYV